LKRGATTWLVAVLCAASLASGGGHAHAQGRPADVQEADRLFKEAETVRDAAMKSRDQAQLDKACDEFARSLELDPALGTKLNLADCHALLGKTATALDEFAEALAMAAKAGDKEREGFARQQIAALTGRVAQVRLELAQGAAVGAVSVDGRSLDRVAWAPPHAIPLDSGTHTFVFSAPGKVARAVQVIVPQGPSTTTVQVAPLDDAPPAPPSATAPPATTVVAPSQPATSETPPAAPLGKKRVVALVSAGVGVAGIVVGTVFGLNALSTRRDGDLHCTGAYCDSMGLALQDDAHTQATVSTVAFTVGAAALVAAVVLWLLPSTF
jgi:hypothetical protein